MITFKIGKYSLSTGVMPKMAIGQFVRHKALLENSSRREELSGTRKKRKKHARESRRILKRMQPPLDMSGKMTLREIIGDYRPPPESHDRGTHRYTFRVAGRHNIPRGQIVLGSCTAFAERQSIKLQGQRTQRRVSTTLSVVFSKSTL